MAQAGMVKGSGMLSALPRLCHTDRAGEDLMPSNSLSLSEARRIVLAAQGFDRPRPAGKVEARHLRQTITRLGLLQLDFVNVLVPAHYLVIFSRLGAYKRSLLDDVVYRGGEFTEQWAHEACIMPVETWPLLRDRMASHRPRPWGFERFIDAHPDYVEAVLKEVRARGPLTADDLNVLMKGIPEIDRAQFGRILGAIPVVQSSAAWVGTVPRAVLEAHFGRGLLAVVDRRTNFARVYDLAERAIPLEHYRRRLEAEGARRQLLRRAAQSLGVGTAADLADYYRMSTREARPRIAELVEAGELQEVRVEGWRETAYLHPQALGPRRASPIALTGTAALLSPFDPLIWYRDRVARLFDFDYRLEIYVPQAKRKWGYYVLPFLLGERLAARVDLKAYRTRRRLLVQAAYLEPDRRHRSEPRVVAEALAGELKTMAGWLDLDSIVVERRGDFARSLGAALRV